MTVHVGFVLFTNIQNMAAVKEMLENDLQAAVVNPSYIVHPDQLVFAVQKCVYCYGKNQLKTKNICTELLYNLSPSKSIKDALKTFGIDESGENALFVLFDKNDDEALTKIAENVDGDLLPVNCVNELTDIEAVRKIYNIPDYLTVADDVLNCIITRMSSKELL